MPAVLAVATMLLTALPILAGRAIETGDQRCHRVVLGGICAFGVLAGAVVYFDRAAGVSPGQALEAAALAAGLLVIAPIAFYLEIGHRLRSRPLLAAVWVTSLVPLLVYLLLVALAINNAECPHGETCGTLTS
jgi:hypothetical protein